MHLSVTLVLLGWLYWRRPAQYRAARTSLVYVNALGLVVFWLVPVAPPRLLAGFVDSGLVTRVAESAAHISPDLYAAMPSLHVAWATWVLVQVWYATAQQAIRGLAVAHLVLTVAVVLATANHFVLDVVAGVAVTAVATVLTRPRRTGAADRLAGRPADRLTGRPAQAEARSRPRSRARRSSRMTSSSAIERRSRTCSHGVFPPAGLPLPLRGAPEAVMAASRRSAASPSAAAGRRQVEQSQTAGRSVASAEKGTSVTWPASQE